MNEIERPDCGHCYKPVLGWGMAYGIPLCHTGTLPATSEPADCYRLVTVHHHKADGSCCLPPVEPPSPAASADDADLRRTLIDAIAGALTATRTVLTDSKDREFLARDFPQSRTFEHGGESWTEFTAVADESKGFTVHYGAACGGAFTTVTVGELADAVLAALRSRPVKA